MISVKEHSKCLSRFETHLKQKMLSTRKSRRKITAKTGFPTGQAGQSIFPDISLISKQFPLIFSRKKLGISIILFCRQNMFFMFLQNAIAFPQIGETIGKCDNPIVHHSFVGVVNDLSL